MSALLGGQRRYGTILVGVAVVGVLVSGALYVKLRRQLRQIQQQVVQEQARFGVMNGLIQAQQRLENYQMKLGQGTDPGWLFEAVQTAAQEAGIQLAYLEPHRPAQRQGFSMISVTMGGQADFGQLGTFLEQLERAESYMQLDVLRMTTEAARPNTRVDQELYSDRFGTPETTEGLWHVPRVIIKVSTVILES